MKYNKLIYLLLFLLIALPQMTSAQTQVSMDNPKLKQILNSNSEEIWGEEGSWQFFYGERLLFIVTDEVKNRMRIFTPIIEEKDMENGDIRQMLEANFHSALDAKYCTYEGFVISVYNHPLEELSEQQLIDAMRQVVTLADNYGSSFSSTNVIFGDDDEIEEIQEEQQTPKKVNQKVGKKI